MYVWLLRNVGNVLKPMCARIADKSHYRYFLIINYEICESLWIGWPHAVTNSPDTCEGSISQHSLYNWFNWILPTTGFQVVTYLSGSFVQREKKFAFIFALKLVPVLVTMISATCTCTRVLSLIYLPVGKKGRNQMYFSFQ